MYFFQIVKQKVEMLEAIVGFETNNKYVIKNSLGQQVYKVCYCLIKILKYKSRYNSTY